MAKADEPAVIDATELARALWAALDTVIRGKPDAIRLALVALLSGGHLLIEDTPGMGKTLLAKALARAVGGTMRRVQGTPDLLPGELTGVSVWEAGRGEWRFHPGPLFANVVLIDEVNRATPRTQAALLEAMEESQVTVDGVTYPLPEPFFVLATQNPFDHAGTFPLVEGQRDRFAMAIEMGYPPRQSERDLLLGSGGVDALDHLGPVSDLAALEGALEQVRTVHCSESLADYVVDLARATRSDPEIRVGASPRASLALLHAAQANALLEGRDFVTPGDVKAVAVPALAHRIILRAGTDRRGAEAAVRTVLDRVAVPRA